MEMAHNVSIPEMMEAISARLVAQWEGWKNQDTVPNDAIIADAFNSFWPDGPRHIGRPMAQQMVEQPITGYKLTVSRRTGWRGCRPRRLLRHRQNPRRQC
jgi:hypothetical protein